MSKQMIEQWGQTSSGATAHLAMAALACTSCKALIHVTAPMEKFTRYRRIACHRCGQPHRIDLYFVGERDCFDLVPATRPATADLMDADD